MLTFPSEFSITSNNTNFDTWYVLNQKLILWNLRGPWPFLSGWEKKNSAVLANKTKIVQITEHKSDFSKSLAQWGCEVKSRGCFSWFFFITDHQFYYPMSTKIILTCDFFYKFFSSCHNFNHQLHQKPLSINNTFFKNFICNFNQYNDI